MAKAHAVSAAIPDIEITDNRDAPGIGCPDGKTHAFYTVHGHGNGAHHTIDLLMLSFREQVKINIP